MKLIVGLGNPGKQYDKTRHNVGFMVVEQFLKDFEPVSQTVWENSAKFKSDIVELDYQRRSAGSGEAKHELVERVILVKPKTFMNNSGMAVKALVDYYKIPTADVWIINDDVDLPLGAMKIRFGGAAAGHRGVTSIIERLGTDKFWRFRMGIGRPKQHVAGSKYYIASMKGREDYVLRDFTGAERGKSRELVKRGTKALAIALENGLDVAMNRFNAR